MNTRQMVALWIGIALIALVTLFPPWVHVLSTHGGQEVTVSVSNIGFLCAPSAVRGGLGVRMDVARLVASWALLILVTGTFVMTSKGQSRIGF